MEHCMPKKENYYSYRRLINGQLRPCIALAHASCTRVTSLHYYVLYTPLYYLCSVFILSLYCLYTLPIYSLSILKIDTCRINNSIPASTLYKFKNLAKILQSHHNPAVITRIAHQSQP